MHYTIGFRNQTDTYQMLFLAKESSQKEQKDRQCSKNRGCSHSCGLGEKIKGAWTAGKMSV